MNETTPTDEDTLLEFPCEFPIKAMGRDEEAFDLLVVSIIRAHIPDLSEGAVDIRASSKGRFVSVTVTVTATSKAQLDAIYRDLTDNERVLVAL